MIQGTLLGCEGAFSRMPGNISGPEDAANGELKHCLKWASAQLSDQAIQIQLSLRKGKSIQGIGSSLAISAYPVKNHLHQIFGKLVISKFLMTDQAPEA